MSKICFVSFEIHPTVVGGCGVFLNNAARILLKQGHKVIFLLDIPKKDFNRFNQIDRLNLPFSENCHAYHVQQLATGMKYSMRDFKSIFEYRSYRMHIALSNLYAKDKPDIIEFFEYCGIGYIALNAKLTQHEYQESHLTIRLHSSLELIDSQQPGSIHGIDRYLMYGLEHHTLRLAETILYPSIRYLEQFYKKNYEPWFGNTIYSKPPLVDKLKYSGTHQDPNIILFYGRLVGSKGVDTFIDAAILYLSNPNHPKRMFYLVGYDSFMPPGLTGSYQDYLKIKIPLKLQDFFIFTGHLSWQELEKLLPDVLFAVVPSYFESFCYAAHELYEAGIPLILSDIPAFQDFFQHGQNALIFNGSIGDLAKQITILSEDEELRTRISHPYSVSQEPLGDFYSNRKHSSWINSRDSEEIPSLLICILCDQTEKLEKAWQSLNTTLTDHISVVFLHPAQENLPGQNVAWFLGKMYSFKDEQRKPIHPTQIISSEAMLILREGDTVDSKFLELGLATLKHQSQISFVGSWKNIQKKNKTIVETLSLDASLELFPFLSKSIFSRFIFRTTPGNLIIDLFDPRAGCLGELVYLWQLDNESNCGVIIPGAFITLAAEVEQVLDKNALDYIIIRDNYMERKKRLARFLLSLSNRSKVLKNHWFTSDTKSEGLRGFIGYSTWNLIDWLMKTRLGYWINQTPWIKGILRKALRIIPFINLD